MIFYDCLTAPSPRRARILLNEKQVPHDVVQVDLMKAEQLSDEFKLINPSCTVPVLKLDDGTIDYLQNYDHQKPFFPMLGSSDIEKGLVASWNWKIEFEGLFAVAETLRNSSPMMKGRAMTGDTDYAQIPDLAERGLSRLNTFFDRLNDRLEGRDFVAIDSFSLADISAVVAVDFARVVKVTPNTSHENIIRWRSNLADRPSLNL